MIKTRSISTSPTGTHTAFPEMSMRHSFRGKSGHSSSHDNTSSDSSGDGSHSPNNKKGNGNGNGNGHSGHKWYTTLNPNNILVTSQEIQKILKKGGISIKIKDLGVWQKAFVHKSYIVKESKNGDSGQNESPRGGRSSPERTPSPPTASMIPLQELSNERLEWLGDAQLQAAVTQYLFKRYPTQNEGFLTKLRSKLVKTNNLSFLANKLGLAPYLIISYHVEFGCHGRINKRILENTFEAFIGAMFIDFSNLKDVPNYAYGYEVVRRFVITAIEKYVDIVEMVMKDDNYKDSLMWFFQKNFSGAYPIYNKEKFENECFHVMVKEPNSNNVVGRGSARSKKQAEQRAAKSALQYYAKKNMTQAPQ